MMGQISKSDLTIHLHESRPALMQSLAVRVAEELRQALASKPTASLAVPGGTTPAPFLLALAQMELDWSRVYVTLTDERWVPESSERSNQRLLASTIFTAKAEAAMKMPFYQDGLLADDATAMLSVQLAPALPLDVCVLGMGEDMHTASIFPQADRLTEALSDNCDSFVLPMRAPAAAEPRVTLTAPVLKHAKHTHILIQGAGKMTALEQALHTPTAAEAPIRLVLDKDKPADIWFAE